MDVHWLFLAFIGLAFTVTVAVPAALLDVDLTKVVEEVERHKKTLDNDFCVEYVEFGFLEVCRRRKHSAFAFLYCKRENYHSPTLDLTCSKAIGDMLHGLTALRKTDIKTVAFYPPVITNVLCRDTGSFDCYGLIETWVDELEGEFHRIPYDYYSIFTIPEQAKVLSQTVIDFTSPSGLFTTFKDLESIQKYMVTPNDASRLYNQIGDLQGFFLFQGGFQVSHPKVNEVKEVVDEHVKATLEAIGIMIDQLSSSYNGGKKPKIEQPSTPIKIEQFTNHAH